MADEYGTNRPASNQSQESDQYNPYTHQYTSFYSQAPYEVEPGAHYHAFSTNEAHHDQWPLKQEIINLCDKCWAAQAAHRKQRLAPGKENPEGLVPPKSEDRRIELHETDEQTAWFDGNPPIFQDYGRYANLLSATTEGNSDPSFRQSQAGRDNRTPSLVSFVGQTGAGKSTLIKLIIDLSVKDDYVPTSEDVHLYSDPLSAFTDEPIFFADCEGLQGGEREPLGAKFKRSRKKSFKSERAPVPTSERELVWANNTTLASRQYAVTNLYPRLLYTFSDVIVFVLKNPRVIESVFEQLVNWAAAALEMSSNQPVLPHAIIALNASNNDIDQEQWDPKYATDSLFESISRTVYKNPTFKKYAQYWRERKREIESVKQLMESYYSSIRVVCIPSEGRPQLIEEQIGKLYSEIDTACAQARDQKAQLRMLLDAEELQSYLQCAFDHFAHSLDVPFDFVQASFSNSPIPLDFGGNILKLAINFMHVWEYKADVQMIFQELSYMVASCIMLDSARNKIRGTATDIFPQYLPHIEAALENFCEKHWPCEYTHPNKGLRCVNVRSGHGSKGHQLKDGKVFAVGGYVSRWSFETLQEEFSCNTYFRFEELLQLLKSRIGPFDDEQRIAAAIHKDDVMTYFYRHVSGDGRPERYNSHTVCFCCLCEPPEHALPCGHVLCSQCIRTYGQQRSKMEIELQGCPLETMQTNPMYQSWRFHLKPESAGVRILTLDGGGIRGIVELEVLRQIQRELGDKLSLQCFFDLIVGTSTGGIVALGLVTRNWTVQECIVRFEELCVTAFTRRTGGNIPLVSWLVDNYNHSKYETKSLHEALQSAFPSHQYLFGGRRTDQLWTTPVKVAVTAVGASNSAMVLANYNRRCDEKLSYQFQRPENMQWELKVWEAARATSAAPRFFKAFHHEPSKQVYMDGALYHNNPIKIADREWKLLWGNEFCEHPDIMLSLGTAYNPHLPQPTARKSMPERLGIVNHGMQLVKLAKNHIEDSLDCEKTWREYLSFLPPNAMPSKFRRYNPIVANPPAMDDVHAMKHLQQEVRRCLIKDSYDIRAIAMQLMATSFYWETDRVQQFVSNSATITGKHTVETYDITVFLIDICTPHILPAGRRVKGNRVAGKSDQVAMLHHARPVLPHTRARPAKQAASTGADA
ncbi:hypothetical protein CC80DRAFT_516035 [Byssothecium circinans]|uniref:FabD/lysophospholipase-like protein n=1 Tax=Byssothecium circinans TaxID=147558 RepID=A0A6A5TVX1_9PLEO|nr:hypothetical protein CC80DRAFT_516035 [Byssothecium circinans]